MQASVAVVFSEDSTAAAEVLYLVHLLSHLKRGSWWSAAGKMTRLQN